MLQPQMWPATEVWAGWIARLKGYAVSEDMKINTTKAVARRRLIRGAFAAPAALTLCSGSAFAATSSNLRALSNQLLKPELAANPVGGTWILANVYKSVHNGNGGAKPDILVVRASEVLGLGCPVAAFLPSDASWATISDSKPYYPDPNRTESLTQPLQYVALRFDASGRIIGVANGSTGGTAVTQSAWTSFGSAAGCN